ncbi:MAG: hypothetical protein EBU79_01220, partial [Betaproteobacteria bacterium]|nr:hypothetical protein [Betaproteobacteria bacterium]NBQ95653.1 hypothetical protein [Betaproteobacteria bacterium]
MLFPEGKVLWWGSQKTTLLLHVVWLKHGRDGLLGWWALSFSVTIQLSLSRLQWEPWGRPGFDVGQEVGQGMPRPRYLV